MAAATAVRRNRVPRWDTEQAVQATKTRLTEHRAPTAAATAVR